MTRSKLVSCWVDENHVLNWILKTAVYGREYDSPILLETLSRHRIHGSWAGDGSRYNVPRKPDSPIRWKDSPGPC